MVKGHRVIIGFVCLMLALLLVLTGCSTSDKCGWCGGSGWVTNGAKNATEFAFKKSVCPYCHGTGKIK